MIDFHSSAQAFITSEKGYRLHIEEIAEFIDDAWLDAVRLFHSENKFSTNQLLNHVSGILDQLMRLAVLGPFDDDEIVLFMKWNSWQHPQSWKFAEEIHRFMRKSSSELSAAREIYNLRNNLSAHGCKPVDSNAVSLERFRMVQDYIQIVLNHIKLMFPGGDE